MKFKIIEESRIGNIIKKNPEWIAGVGELDEELLLTCTQRAISPVISQHGQAWLELIEGESFHVVDKNGEEIYIECQETAHIGDLLLESAAIIEEACGFELKEIREVSRELGYIPANVQGAKQILKKFQGREQEFLNLLKEKFPK